MNRENDIRQQFQSKFNDFKAPVPADGWERLEQSLNAATAAKAVIRRRWYIGSAAAVLVLLVGSLLFLQNPAQQPEPIVSEVVPTPQSETVSEPDNEAHKENLQQMATPLAQNVRPLAMKTDEKRQEEIQRPAGVSDVIAAWFNRAKKEVTSGEKESSESRTPEKTTSPDKTKDKADENRKIEEFVRAGDRGDLFADQLPDGKKEEKVMLALGGRGGLTSFQKTVNAPMTLRSAAVAGDAKYSDENRKMVFTTNSTADNVSEMEHDQPVSFGITVSKALADGLSVETGLVYTYLYSKVRNTNANFKEQENQRIHYLGIPVNVNYTLFSMNKLDVYASLGGMIEKDVYGEYRKMGQGQQIKEQVQEFNSVAEEAEVTRIKQKNPQISVNAGVGASYPIYNNLKLYGKIGGAYYFDAKNEHKTIYSDRKIVMDVNLGLRYEF